MNWKTGVGANLREKIAKATRAIDRCLYCAIRQHRIEASRDHGAAVRIQRPVNKAHGKLAKRIKNAKITNKEEKNNQEK